jgi:uncharacterized protein YciI
MPLYCLTCIDKPKSLELRMANREAHLAHVRDARQAVKLGGPFIDTAGGMAGSMILLEAPDLAAAEAFSAADPYTRAGLFERVEIREFRANVGTYVAPAAA